MCSKLLKGVGQEPQLQFKGIKGNSQGFTVIHTLTYLTEGKS